MESLTAACVIVLVLVFMVFARIFVFPRNHPKTELIIKLLNSLPAGRVSPVEYRRGHKVLGGANNG